MNTREKLDLAHWIVEQARKYGANDASVSIGNSRTVDVEFRDGKVDKLTEATENGMGLSIYAKGRYSTHSTCDLRKSSLGKFIEEAVAMTLYLGEDKFRVLPDPARYEGQKSVDLRLRDAAYERVSSDQRVNLAKEIEAIGAAEAGKDRLVSYTAWYSDTLSQSVDVQSNGFEGHQESTVFGAGAQATLKGTGDSRLQDWDWYSARFHKDLPPAEALARGAVQRAAKKYGASKMDTGTYDMLVDNRCSTNLIGALTGCMSGSSLYQKSTFLEGKLGEKIVSDKLSIIDDPFIVGGLGSALYDGDCMATKKRVMIDKGVLKSYYIGNYYGRKLKMEPTIGGGTNTIYAYGDRSQEEMIRDIAKGILITSFVGGNSNGTTGDFSYGIVGLYIEDGKIIKPVNEMNISANQTEFWDHLAEVGNDPYMHSSNRRPTLFFKDIHFSGV